MRNITTIPGILLLFIEVLALAVLAVVSSHLFGMADGIRVTLAYLVAYLVPRAVLKRARGTSQGAHVVLLLLAIFLSWVALDCLQAWSAPEGYSLQRPCVDGDAHQYYLWALYHYDGSVEESPTVFPGFPLVMLGLWKVLGLSVIWPQALNMMCTLTSVVLIGMTTRRLLAHRVKVSNQALLLTGMVLTCLLQFYLMSGISILKEGIVFLSVSMAGFALASMATSDEERHRPWRDIATFVAACVIMAFIRTTFLYVLLLGVLVMALPHWRRDWMVALFFAVIIVVLMVVGNHFASYSFNRHAEIVGGGWNMQRIYFKNPIYKRLIGYYFLYSTWHKVALLPLTMSLQFFLPFPWFTDYETPVLLNILCHASYGWYFIGGTVLFYFLFMSWRRDGNMGAWPWWSLLYLVALAYIMAGSMSRYVLPIQILLVPVAAYVLCRLYEGYMRRQFVVYFLVFALLVAAALLLCLELHTGTLSSRFDLPFLADYLPVGI